MAEQKAYWINAYNAFTIKLVIDHYPVRSIRDIGFGINIPFVTTPWQKKFFKIGNRRMKLDNIEHIMLRKKFFDPRIHFALVCASKSCANLRVEAYSADKLERQLEEQTKNFIADNTKNEITPARADISRYFSWYQADFTKQGSLIEFINKYSEVQLFPNAMITFKHYDWDLNEQ